MYIQGDEILYNSSACVPHMINIKSPIITQSCFKVIPSVVSMQESIHMQPEVQRSMEVPDVLSGTNRLLVSNSMVLIIWDIAFCYSFIYIPPLNFFSFCSHNGIWSLLSLSTSELYGFWKMELALHCACCLELFYCKLLLVQRLKSSGWTGFCSILFVNYISTIWLLIELFVNDLQYQFFTFLSSSYTNSQYLSCTYDSRPYAHTYFNRQQ